MRRIAVTGMGIVSSLGWSPDETWAGIEEGRSGLGELSLFKSPRCGHLPVAEVRADLQKKSGLVEGSRNDHLATYAAREAFQNAGLYNLDIEELLKVGAVMGASTGGMLDTEVFLQKVVRENCSDTKLLKFHECASSVNTITRELGLGGPRMTISNACSSGAAAISAACDMLEAREANIMLAGGVDSLTRLTLNGFASLLIVAPDGCRPFDAKRAGMSLGEGAAVLVLETEESVSARNAEVIAWIAGRASTCDAYHASAPSTGGDGIFRAMSLALERSGFEPSDVGYINAHGTGTLDNDIAEAEAIKRLFGESIPPVSSTKRFFGHTLAAAGAIEALVTILALRRGKAPANLGLREVDPAIGFQPPVKTTSARIDVAISNSIGFGGNNCSLVICGPETVRRQ